MLKDKSSFFRTLMKSLFYGAIFGFIGVFGVMFTGGIPPICIPRISDLICSQTAHQEWLKAMTIAEFFHSLYSAILETPKWVLGSVVGCYIFFPLSFYPKNTELQS